jgi:AbrB family looped-hinge helix DNA binding protein
VKSDLAETVTVTSKGQVTIPSKLRRDLKITKGEKLIVIRENDTIRIIPVRKLSKLAGVDEAVFKGKKPSAEIEAMRKEWTKEFDKGTRET